MFLKPVAAVLNGKPCVGEKIEVYWSEAACRGSVGGAASGAGPGVPSTSRIMMFSLSFLFHRQATLPKCSPPPPHLPTTTTADPPVTWISWGDNEEASPERRARRCPSSPSRSCGAGGYFGNPSGCFSSGQRRGAQGEGEIGMERRGGRNTTKRKTRQAPSSRHKTSDTLTVWWRTDLQKCRYLFSQLPLPSSNSEKDFLLFVSLFSPGYYFSPHSFSRCCLQTGIVDRFKHEGFSAP